MTTITVTQELIDAGIRGECRRCPVALAVKAHVRPDVIVRVDRHDIDIECVGATVTIPTPSKAAKFIAAYDGAMFTVPFEFELDIPEWALKEAL